MAFTQRQTIDLTRSNPVLIREQPLEKGDASALCWIVTVKEDGRAADLTGMNAVLYCARSGDTQDGTQSYGTVMSGASIEGSTIRAVLPSDATNVPGGVACVLRVADSGGAQAVMARMVVRVMDVIGADIVDEGKRVPNIDDLLAQIDVMRTAISDANAAAYSATTQAAAAQSAASSANTAASSATTQAAAAQSAAGAAGTAAGAANAAAAQITEMTIAATILPEGSAPTAAISDVDGHKHVVLGIPKGDKGNTGATGTTPNLTIHVATGEPGSEVKIEQSGTAEQPVILLTIPRGDTGSIGTLTINGKTPDASGTVTLTAADVGARPDTWMPTAADVGARPDTWMPTAADVGAYAAGSIRALAISLATSAWTGSGPYTATITRSDVTTKTWVDIHLDAASQASYNAAIDWSTETAGQITLSTTVKPTGTLAGSMVLTETA